MNLKEIAELKNLSVERVRQILTRDVVLETKEFEQKLKEYEKMIESCDRGKILKEIIRLSKESRLKRIVEERRILLRHLKNVYGLNLVEMGWYLRRHHTTILNMLENK